MLTHLTLEESIVVLAKLGWKDTDIADKLDCSDRLVRHHRKKNGLCKPRELRYKMPTPKQMTKMNIEKGINRRLGEIALLRETLRGLE